MSAKLKKPLIVELHGIHDAHLGERIKDVQKRMGVEIISGRHLRLDVGYRQKPPTAHVHALRDLRKIKLAVEGRHVVAVGAIFGQELIAEDSLHYRVPVVETLTVLK